MGETKGRECRRGSGGGVGKEGVKGGGGCLE